MHGWAVMLVPVYRGSLPSLGLQFQPPSEPKLRKGLNVFQEGT